MKLIYLILLAMSLAWSNSSLAQDPVITLQLPEASLCIGQKYLASFTSNVNSEAYLVHISDQNGSFTSSLTVAAATGFIGRQSGTIEVIIPDNVVSGGNYRLRAVAAVSNFLTMPGRPSSPVTVRSAPPVQIIIASGSNIICPGQAVVLQAMTRATDVTWSNGATGPTITVTNPGNYAAQTQGEGCARTSNNIEISSGLFSQGINITVNGALALCEGKSVEMSVPLAAGLTYQWRRNGQNVGIVNSNSLRVQQLPGEYDVVISSPCGSITTPKLLVSLKAIVPPPTVNRTEITRCGPGTLNLVASGGVEGNYRWFDDDFNQLASGGSRFTTPSISRSGNVYVALEEFGCLSQRIRIGVQVNPATMQADAGPDVSVIQGEQVQMEAKGQLLANNAIVATANTESGFRYQWTPSNGLSNPTLANPLASPLETITYTVTVRDANGCEARDEVTVTVRHELKVPNGFSPNADGINDTWEIGNMDTQPDAQVTVFDRWGHQVFASVGYQQPWDGTFQSRTLPQDVYFYVITYQNGRARLKGQLNIIR